MHKYQAIRRKTASYSKRAKKFWERYRKNKIAVMGLIVFILLVFTATGSPQIAPFDPFEIDLKEKFSPPNLTHLMGTDEFGRDIYSRIVWGTRVSLIIGVGTSLIAFVIGVSLGAISGYFGGKTDAVIMRVVEIFMTLPTFFLILTIVAIFGSNLLNVLILIAITRWPSTARLIRAQFLTFKQRDFVEAARGLGASKSRIIFSEILPNAIFPGIVDISMRSAGAIMIEASLSFLGLSDPNYISWGRMLNWAIHYLRQGWWVSVFPGIAIAITVLAFNLIGDGLNDALNPYSKER